ncbi:MAG: type III secretion system export apparatus subunit SctS [Myxococcales bacterium]|nr:type III secretion system export apparatus subunit SctS [Myxococcales bacterium]
MNQVFISQIVSEGLFLTLVISAPPVLCSLLVGLLVSLFQAATQIQEQAFSFVTKLVIVFGVLSLVGPRLGQALVNFGRICFEGFASSIGR